MCVQSLSWGRLPPVINHSTLTYVCTVTIMGQTATSHQPFHPDLCVYSHYHGADCHQSSTIPPWPMCVQSLSWGRLPPVINHSTLTYVCTVTIMGQTATSHQPFHPGLCVPLSRCRLPPVINHSTLAYVCTVTIQVQTATNHQPFHPGLCVSLSRCRLPPVINHSTLTYVCTVTIQVQTATNHQPFHPDLCVYSHYPGADCHQSSTIPP